MRNILIRNNKNEIICNRHYFIAHKICLEKNCQNNIILSFVNVITIKKNFPQ